MMTLQHMTDLSEELAKGLLELTEDYDDAIWLAKAILDYLETGKKENINEK